MPQPATHYLVTRRAIPREHWENWWDKHKPYFGLGSSAPDLFYFPLMPKVEGVSQNISWEDIANPLHASRSYDMFCTLLTKAKQHKDINISEAEKQFAFAIGYYCHVITDCVFHPYVYRSTGDHWDTTDYKNELKHKEQEFFIDTGIFQKYYDKKHDFARIQWECPGKDDGVLDGIIAQQLHSSLQEVYPDCYPVSHDLNDREHPIHQAYSALVQSIATLFEGTEVYLFGQRVHIETSALRKAMPTAFFMTPYPACPTLDSYTPEDLFNFSSVACRKLFLTSLGFWNSDAKNVREYFNENAAHYLNMGNWNLDTGLPCQYNNLKVMREESSEHYHFKADELKKTYNILRAEYDEFSS